jgi:hypothetical protein
MKTSDKVQKKKSVKKPNSVFGRYFDSGRYLRFNVDGVCIYCDLLF